MRSTLKYSWLFSIAFVLVGNGCLIGQSIKRQTLGTVGGSMSYGGVTIQQTVGQPTNTQSAYHAQAGIRQGFLQPSLLRTLERFRVIALDVYPNPTLGPLTISTPFLPADVLHVFSGDGKLILQTTINATATSHELLLGQLPAGQYTLQLLRDNTLFGTAKINKL